jgi:hypothetical protein
MEFERREIVSKLSGIGRNICASGLNGRTGTSESIKLIKTINLF